MADLANAARAFAPVAGNWADRIHGELAGNILPFWPRHVMDRVRGGFFGTVASDLTVDRDAPRSCVVNTRILWTYSAAARLIDPAYRPVADWAFDYVAGKFRDADNGGLFWMLNADGRPLADRKQTYAQAFGIYALAEHHRLTGAAASLDLARQLYDLIESQCSDPGFGGYWEARGRTWQALDDVRLSDKDLNCPKSMNTHLHVLEAYTNLMRVWPDAGLKARHRALLELMLDRVVDAGSGHFKLFFDARWTSLSGHVSFGHDIEGSWLLAEAADVLGDAALKARARRTAVATAEAVTKGLEDDGSLLYEADADGRIVDGRKHWWAQAEAVIGFYNAFEITGEARFRAASLAAWDYIERYVVDRVHGEWHGLLSRQGVALSEADDPGAHLVGPWKCPYHNARVCFEMLQRLARTQTRPR